VTLPLTKRLLPAALIGLGMLCCVMNGFAGPQVEMEVLWDPPSNFSSLKGRFTQYKSIDILPRPLQSEGHFIYEPRGKLSWFVTRPVESHIEVFADRIVQIDGEQVIELRADKYPFVRIMSDIFFGILSGKMPHKHFDITRHQKHKGWQLELLPLDKSLARAIVSIGLAGDKQLDEFTMVEVNGDRLRIEFYQLSYQ